MRAQQPLPRGVYAIAILLFVFGGGLLLAALVLPLTGTNIIGDSMIAWYWYVLYAAYFIALGWGLWGGRRWGYIATLLMCAVLGFYQLQTAVILGRNSLLQFLALAAIFAYLIQGRVRAAFLKGRVPPEATRDT